MALVLWSLYDGYRKYVVDAQDPRTVDLFLMNPPWVSIAIVGAYLYFVFKLGPKWMANRKPYNLRQLLLLYNFLQIAANLYISIIATHLWMKQPLPIICRPVDRTNSEFALREVKLVHYYYLLKIADLIDTVFFVLRKKQSQITFLHVYHHAAMALGPLFHVRVYPGGSASSLGLCNVYVHTVMYVYFFISVYRPEWTARNSHWKRYLTILQMGQFVALAIIFGAPLVMDVECGISKFWFFVLFAQNVFMFTMFADFYVKAYRFRKAK